jgi:hypothetical protein
MFRVFERLSLLLLLLMASVLGTEATGTELLLRDVQAGYHDAVHNTRHLMPDTFATYRGCRQEGQYNDVVYDTLYEIVLVFERPTGPISFSWQDVQFFEFVQDYYMSQPAGPSSTGQVFLMWGPKLDQSTSQVGESEFGRPMLSNNYWTILTSSVYLPFGGWGRQIRPAYTSQLFGALFRMYAQADMRYLALHIQPAYTEDTVRVRMTDTPNCQYSMWSLYDTELDYFPADVPIACVSPTVDEGMYLYDLAALDVPVPSDGDVYLLSVHGDTLCATESGRSATQTLLLSESDLQRQPDCLLFRGADAARQVVLLPYDFTGPWPGVGTR